MVLRKGLRDLHFDPQTTGSELYSRGHNLSKGELTTYYHSDTLPATRPYLLIVPLPLGGIFSNRPSACPCTHIQACVIHNADHAFLPKGPAVSCLIKLESKLV